MLSAASQMLIIIDFPLYSIFLSQAAVKAMSELGVAGCIGASCVQQKLVTQDMLRALSKTIYTILLPFFIGTNLMKTVTSQGGRLGLSSLGVPIMAVLQSAILFGIATNILLPLFGIDPDTDDGKVMSITCCFGNAGVLPFVFADSIFRGNAPLLQDALSQTSFFSAGWSPFFWSFVPKVLQISGNKNAVSGKKTPEKPGKLDNLLRDIKVFFPPPVIGVVTGILVALSPLRPLLMSTDATKPAPLAVVYNSFQNMGKAASPLAVLVLTCSLAFGAGKKVQQRKDVAVAGPLRKWACVSTARFLVSPLIMIALLRGMAKIGLVGSKEAEPMLWFVCLLQSIMPPAQNSVVLLQVAGRSDEAGQMAKFLFSIYATAMLPIICLVTASLDSLGIVP